MTIYQLHQQTCNALDGIPRPCPLYLFMEDLADEGWSDPVWQMEVNAFVAKYPVLAPMILKLRLEHGV